MWKIISWPVRKLRNYTRALNTSLEAPNTIKEAYTNGFSYVTKVTGVTAGVAGIGKGTVDALEAYACNDGICFVVSCVGTVADGLHIAASFVPGPNFTAVVTVPVSVGCKVFVAACKSAKALPWKPKC